MTVFAVNLENSCIKPHKLFWISTVFLIVFIEKKKGLFFFFFFLVMFFILVRDFRELFLIVREFQNLAVKLMILRDKFKYLQIKK